MTSLAPTPKQRAILAFIASKKLPPTIREIGAAFGIASTNGVNDHLKALERKGLLTRGDVRARDLRPTARGFCAIGKRSRLCPSCAAEVPTRPAVNSPPAGMAAQGGERDMGGVL